jgi:acyl-CoA synthetase (NDP forming)
LDLGRLLAPRNVAVIGGRSAVAVVRQLRRLGYAGTIWPVSASRAEIVGIAAFPALDALPATPDAAFVGVNAVATVRVVGELAAMGCGGAICFASGFAEAGNTALQAELVAAAGAMPLLGPNCHGLVNALDRTALFPDEQGLAPVARGVAILSQSGNIGLNLTMQRRSLPIGLLVTLGNQAVLDAGRLVDAIVEDGRITAVGLHLEGAPDIGALARAALKARERRVPIVALKAGRSRRAGAAAFSHTGALVGDDRLWDALLGRLGIARVDTPAELLEALKLLHCGGPLSGRRLGSLSCSGGEAAMVADLALPVGLELPPLPEATAHALRAVLGEAVPVANPLDYHTWIWGNGEALEHCCMVMLGAGFDLTALVLDWPTHPSASPASWDVALDALVAAQASTGARAAVVATLPEGLPEDRRERLMAAGIAPMQGIGEAVRAMAAAALIGEAWRGPMPGELLAAADPGAEPAALDETTSKRLLAAAGIPVPEGQETSPTEAAGVADRLGFPVALKATGPVHKSDSGGVHLGLRTLDEVAGVAPRLGGRVRVERMIEGAVAEVLLTVARRPPFGWALTIGAGGVLAELLDDTATLLLPVTETELRATMSRLRLARLLDGWRGRPAGDVDALIGAALALAAFTQREPRLVELEINPLLVMPVGRGVCAVDARARVATS